MKNIIILNSYKGFTLCKENDFYFILGMNYIDLKGKRENILKELKRWKIEVDNNNEYMLDIENHFINILEKMEEI